MTGTGLATDPDPLIEHIESDLTTFEIPSKRTRVAKRAAELLGAQIIDVAELFVAEAQQPPNAISKLHIFGEALEAYLQRGDSEKVNEG